MLLSYLNNKGMIMLCRNAKASIRVESVTSREQDGGGWGPFLVFIKSLTAFSF